MGRLRGALLALLIGIVAAQADTIPQLADQARAEAKQWHSDARLVQIDLSDFGFAMDTSGIPDMTKAGPPSMVLFHFLSLTAQQALRISMQLKLTPEQVKFLQEHGGSVRQVEQLPTPYSSYTLPIPETFIGPDQAIAQAQHAITTECAGTSLEARSCPLVSGAELHVFWSGQGESGTPVWTIRFGQNPKTLHTVTRTIDATSGALVALQDTQRGSLQPEPNPHLQQIALPNVQHEFDAVWRAVNQAVTTQDPLYRPYAATLIVYLHENRGPHATVSLAEAAFQYARITPSLYWDDRIVHVKWAGATAMVDMSPAVPRRAPEEPLPRIMEYQHLSSQETTLRHLVDVFPPGYAEQYTTWERGCQDLMSASPNIVRWGGGHG